MFVSRTASLVGFATAVALLSGACNADPRYVDPPDYVEVGVPDSDVFFATTQVLLPIRLEEEQELEERALLAQELGLPMDSVPYVLLDDLAISIEWTIRNLEDREGTARVHVNGGNEYFYYVPQNFVIDPDEDEEPPALMGDIPMTVPALGTIGGVFREDQVYEAALDMELITRGGVNPFAAILEQHDDVNEVTDPAAGMTIPRAAFAHMVQYDVSLEANRHMVLEYTIRVRDEREILHDLLLQADTGELTAFAPVEFVPPPPDPMP